MHLDCIKLDYSINFNDGTPLLRKIIASLGVFEPNNLFIISNDVCWVKRLKIDWYVLQVTKLTSPRGGMLMHYYGY